MHLKNDDLTDGGTEDQRIETRNNHAQSVARRFRPKARHAAAALLVFCGPAVAADIRVTVAGAVANGTVVYASLCDGGLDVASCKIGMRQQANASVLTILFSGVAPGRYAVVAFQDLDGDGTLERSKLGLPLEPYAVSRNAGRQRRPTFQAASFPVASGETDVALQLRTLQSRNDDR